MQLDTNLFTKSLT